MPASTRPRRFLLCYLSIAIGGVFGYSFLSLPAKTFNNPAYHPLVAFLPLRVWGGVFMTVAAFALAAMVGRAYRVAFYGFAALAAIQMMFAMLLTFGAIQTVGARGLVTGIVYVALALYTALAALAAWDCDR